MDRYLVSGKQPWEPETVVERMRKKEGIECSVEEVREIIKEHGHSRRRIYAIIRERRQAAFEARANDEQGNATAG